jgi:GNAT superfamily N-acetyltransferase
VNGVAIAPATESEIRAFASRRCSGEASHRLYVQFAQSSPRGAWAARDADAAIGIGFAHALGDEWFLSELYVEPSFRAHGIGRALLQEVARDAGDVWRSCLLDAGGTQSLTFFLRRGLALRVPVLSISGAMPREEDVARMAAGEYRFTAVPVDLRVHAPWMDALDREVRGASRPEDHVGFAELATGTSFFLNDELVGYVYVWPDGRIGPLAAASAAYLVQLLAFAFMSLRRSYRASWCRSLVPGNNVRALRAATRVGLAIDRIHLFATDRPDTELSRYLGFTELAF